MFIIVIFECSRNQVSRTMSGESGRTSSTSSLYSSSYASSTYSNGSNSRRTSSNSAAAVDKDGVAIVEGVHNQDDSEQVRSVTGIEKPKF